MNLIRWSVMVSSASIPLLLLGNRPILKDVLGVHIPASALMVAVPAAVTFLEARRDGRLAELRMVARLTRSDIAAVPIVIAVPLFITAGDQWFQGHPFPVVGSFVALAGSIATFTFAAALEEIGWSAWLMRRMNQQQGLVASSLIVGTMWAAWHIIPWIRLGHSPSWLIGQSLNTIALRWFMSELTLRSNRWLWPAIVAHASSNLAWSLTAADGAAYRPTVSAMGFAIVAGGFALLRRD